jgi:hypothetical protein
VQVTLHVDKPAYRYFFGLSPREVFQFNRHIMSVRGV